MRKSMKRIEEVAKEYAEDKIDSFGVNGVPNGIKDIKGFVREAYLAGAEQVQNNVWYKTAEETPTDFGSVLVIYPDNVCLVAYYDKYMHLWRDTTNHNEICEPLAWMKLPKYHLEK